MCTCMLQGKNISNDFWAKAINTSAYLKEENLMQSELSAYLLVIVIIRKHTSCLIPALIDFLQVGMWCFMRMQRTVIK